MNRINWTWCLLITTVLFGPPANAGQDIFELDFDPVAELGNRGLDTSIQGLESTLANENVDDISRYYAAVAIGQLKNTRSFDILVNALEDSNEHVVIGALTGLTEMNDDRAIPKFEQHLRGVKNPALAHAALIGLAKRNTEQARRVMADTARDIGQDRETRIAAMSLFRRSPDRLSDNLFEELLDNESDIELRARAAIGLSQRFSTEYDLKLTQILSDRSLPTYVWSDIVRHFERKAGIEFDAAKERRGANKTLEDKQRTQDHIRAWASGRSGSNDLGTQ